VRWARLWPIVAVAAALAATVAGFARGTYVAGGPDSYCYLSQAELFASGHIVNVQPIASEAPWDRGSEAFIPVGHVRAYAPRGATVPMCPPGYPLIMAAVRAIAGRAAMFGVVPILGGLGVWWTFLLGRRIGDATAGAAAAVLLAASPPFLYQIVQPMSDVPAAALWAAALVAVTSQRFSSSFIEAIAGGVVTGVALIVRPNLLPLVAVVAFVVFTRRNATVPNVLRTWTGFAIGVAPFAIAIGVLQNAMYGGPFKSGYGDLDFLFRLDHVRPNLQRYPLWLLQTETPIVLLALASPLLARDRRTCVWLLAFVAAVFACYVPYEVFDAWWYLRFLLPAYPPLLVLTAVALTTLCGRMPARWRVGETVVVALLAFYMVRLTIDRGTFGLRDFERRFRLGGEYVAAHLPENAAVVTGQESGSVRFYSGRLTLFWRELPPDALDRALQFLRDRGYRPYLLLEPWEQMDFVQRFDAHSRSVDETLSLGQRQPLHPPAAGYHGGTEDQSHRGNQPDRKVRRRRGRVRLGNRAARDRTTGEIEKTSGTSLVSRLFSRSRPSFVTPATGRRLPSRTGPRRPPFLRYSDTPWFAPPGAVWRTMLIGSPPPITAMIAIPCGAASYSSPCCPWRHAARRARPRARPPLVPAVACRSRVASGSAGTRPPPVWRTSRSSNTRFTLTMSAASSRTCPARRRSDRRATVAADACRRCRSARTCWSSSRCSWPAARVLDLPRCR